MDHAGNQLPRKGRLEKGDVATRQATLSKSLALRTVLGRSFDNNEAAAAARPVANVTLEDDALARIIPARFARIHKRPGRAY